MQMQETIKKEMNYEAEKLSQQIYNDIKGKVGMAENIGNMIGFNANVVSFLGQDYTPPKDIHKDNGSDIKSQVSQAVIYNQMDIEQYYLFMENKTIPEGWGNFWSVRRIENKEWYKQLQASKDKDLWIHSTEKELFEANIYDVQDLSYCIYARKIMNVQGGCLGVLVLMFQEDEFYFSSIDKTMEVRGIRILDDAGEEIAAYLPNEGSDFEKVLSKQVIPLNCTIETMQSLKSQKALFKYTGTNLIFIILGLILSIVVFYSFIRSVFVKINHDVKIVEQAITGDDEIRVEVHSSDEMGKIANAFNSLIEKNNALVKDIIKREVMQKTTQLKALQFQINPHFFYNTLDIIAGKLVLCGNIEVADVIADFGKMLRYNISARTMRTTVKIELQYIKQYMGIQKLRYGERISYHIDTEEAVNGIEIIKFILQPIVENSISHGFEDGEGMLSIVIQCSLYEKNLLKIVIEDNGKGLEEKELEEINRILQRSEYTSYEVDATLKERGIGLENINERLKLFYGEEFGLKMEHNEERGMKTIILIPILGEGGERDV